MTLFPLSTALLLLTVSEANPPHPHPQPQPRLNAGPNPPHPHPAPGPKDRSSYSARMSRGDYYYADYSNYDDDDYYYDDDSAYDSYYDSLVASFGEQNIASLFDDDLLEDEHYWAGYRAGLQKDQMYAEMRGSWGFPKWSDVKKKSSEWWTKFKNLPKVKQARQYAFDYAMVEAEKKLIDPMMKEVMEKINEAKTLALNEINKALSADLEAKLATVGQDDVVPDIKTFINDQATHLCNEIVAQWPERVGDAWNHMKKYMCTKCGVEYTAYSYDANLDLSAASAHRAYSNLYGYADDDDMMMAVDVQWLTSNGKKWAMAAMKELWSESYNQMVGYSNQQFQSTIDTMKKTLESMVNSKLEELLDKLTSKITGDAAKKLDEAFEGDWKQKVEKFVKEQFDKLAAKLTAMAEKEAKDAFNAAKAKLLGSAYDAEKHDLKARRSPYNRLARQYASRYNGY